MATISIEFSVASCSTSSVVRWMSSFTYFTASTVPGHLSLLLYSFCYVRIFARLHILRHLNFQTCSDTEVFCTFDFQMCFAPQRHALFRHLNFQKGSDHGAFCTFWLGNVLRATKACNFSCLISPHGSAPAALVSLLFDPPELQIIGKFRGFPTFSRTCIFFLLTLLTLSLSLTLFHLPISSEAWLLNFLRLCI